LVWSQVAQALNVWPDYRNAAVQSKHLSRLPIEGLSINLSSQFVEGIDFRVRYSFDIGDLGNFSASLGGSYYTRWEYLPDEYSAYTSGIADQNAETNLAPPLSRYKFNTGLLWFRNNQSASITARRPLTGTNQGRSTIAATPMPPAVQTEINPRP
jgi:hypothetical protein